MNFRTRQRTLIDTKKELNDLVEAAGFDSVEDLQEISEAVTASVVKVTPQQKINKLAGLLAVKLAEKNNDPIYAKYKKARKLFLSFKQLIIKKYMIKAKPLARAALNK